MHVYTNGRDIHHNHSLRISTLVPFVDVEILILQSHYQDITKEVKKLVSIRHRNVMSHFGIGRHMEEVHIFLEFIHGETLNSILKRQGCYYYNTSCYHMETWIYQVLTPLFFIFFVCVNPLHAQIKVSLLIKCTGLDH